MKVLIVYYSMYGHIRRMAEAVKEGAGSVSGADVRICRVPETLPDEVLIKMGALETQKAQAHVPVCTVEDLVSADAIIFGTPTRFGNMCGQMRQFLDATGGLWAKGCSCRQSGERFHLKRNPARRAGIDYSFLSYHPPAPGHDNRRPSLYLCGADAHRRDHGGVALRGFHDRRGRRKTDAERKRARCSALSGQARCRNCSQTVPVRAKARTRLERISLEYPSSSLKKRG